MEYEETDSTQPAIKIHKVVRAKSKKKKMKSAPKRGGVGFVPDIDDGGMIGESGKTESRIISEYLVQRIGRAMNIARGLGKEEESEEESDNKPAPTRTAPDKINGMMNIAGIVPKTPGALGPEQSTTRPDGTPVVPDEDAYQTEPIPNQPAGPGVKPAENEAEPSASVNTIPDMSGGMLNFGYAGQDPRKMYEPQSSVQFQTQGYDFGSMKSNFMKESSVQSLLDEILNEKHTELNLSGSFGEPVRSKDQDDKAYIKAALFNAMKKQKDK